MGRSLDGSVVALVGATGGLGTPIARELRSQGAVLIEASRTADVGIDIRDVDAGRQLVDIATERHGRLDGVIVASGIVAFGDLADTDDVVAEELFLTNVLGPLWLARRVLPMLSESNGFFAAITGVVADQPMPGMAAYSASKAALSAALTAVRREFRRSGVGVIEIRPPHTETGLATRPVAGTAPKLPTGLDPEAVARRIVAAISDGTDVLAATDFDGA